MDTNKKQRIYRTIMLIIITVFITFLMTATFMYNIVLKDQNIKYVTVTGGESNIATILASFRKIIDQNYLGEVDEKSLLEGAIKGYVAGLKDPYTEYFTKEELADYTEDALGNFTGIGIYMVKDTEKNVITVLTPIEGTPAEQAGIKPGDIITKVDGVSYTAETMSEASAKIKGEPGTTVKLEVLRDSQLLEIEVKRGNIKVYHVKSEKLENNIGYLKLTTFDEGCAEEFKNKYNELKEQGITSLIVDLRNNGGGIVEEATDIADMFLEKGKDILIIKDKKGNEKVTKSEKDPIITIPTIILTNDKTASASEILAGALKDHERAKIVGTKTYGKGVIQVLKQFTDGSGIKITTSEYFTPNHTKINKIGIEPDVTVELPEDLQDNLSVERDKDKPLQKAIELLK